MSPEQNIYLENLYLKQQILQLQSQLMQIENTRIEREIAAIKASQPGEQQNVPDSIQS